MKKRIDKMVVKGPVMCRNPKCKYHTLICPSDWEYALVNHYKKGKVTITREIDLVKIKKDDFQTDRYCAECASIILGKVVNRYSKIQ